MPFVSIYKTFWGAYLDFDQLVMISPVYYDYIRDIVGFSMQFKDADKEIHYSREADRYSERQRVYSNTPQSLRVGSSISEDEIAKCPRDGAVFLKTVEGKWVREDNIRFDKNPSNLAAVANLQKQVDEIVADWETWKVKKMNILSSDFIKAC